MAVYEYACAQHGRFDVRLTIGTAPDLHRCPVCDQASRRAFSPPMLGSVSRSEKTLFGWEERSSDAPEVVTEVPPKAGTSAPPPHPALARLPRP